MSPETWTLQAEIAAGDVWVGVAKRQAIKRIDRTHRAEFPQIGMWLSGRPQTSRARFLAAEPQPQFSNLGAVVAVPPDVALQVLGEDEPEGRMVHCRLPRRDDLRAHGDAGALKHCLDVRSPSIVACLRRLANEALAPGFASATAVEGLGLFLAAELSIHLDGAEIRSAARGGLAPWQLKRIDEHLQAGNWNSSVSDLANLCGLSPSHAMRAFRQATGRTMTHYVAERRVERAQVLLSRSSRTIAEVAQELQFAYPSAFAAAFRRATGVSPRSYRQSSRS